VVSDLLAVLPWVSVGTAAFYAHFVDNKSTSEIASSLPLSVALAVLGTDRTLLWAVRRTFFATVSTKKPNPTNP
jgi:hypothetical protein